MFGAAAAVSCLGDLRKQRTLGGKSCVGDSPGGGESWCECRERVWLARDVEWGELADKQTYGVSSSEAHGQEK